MRTLSTTLAAAMAATLVSGAALADVMNLGVDYFTVSGSEPGFGTPGICCSVSPNMVLSTLGPNGLPVLNPAATDLKPGELALLQQDTNSHGELNFWTVGGHVTSGGPSGTVSIPYAVSEFYPDALNPGHGTADGAVHGYMAAVFAGKFTLATASTVTFSLGADDEAFFYVDGKIVDQIGGIHPNTAAPVTTGTLAAGDHTLELFYDDRYPTQASLSFGLVTEGITITPTPPPIAVPEPGVLGLLGFGIAGVAFLRRRA